MHSNQTESRVFCARDFVAPTYTLKGSTMTQSSPQRPRSTWTVLAALALVGVGIEAGCMTRPSDGEQLSEEAQDALRGMLEDAWPDVISLHLEAARAATVSLAEATSDWSADPTSTEARAAAQEAWASALAAWQETEVMQLGPAGDSLKFVGGQDLRDEIYSWPLTNPCMVDQRTARGEYAEATFFDDVLVNSTGFDALETLLFSEPNTHVCPSQVLRDNDWESLGAEGVAQARADYAGVLTDQIIVNIDAIVGGWEDSFGADLASAGTGGSSFKEQLEAANAIYDALFYLETRSKDRKLGWPLGLTDCGADSCTGEIETPLAGGSQQWLASNLKGFRALFIGGEGLGMSDLLAAVGHQDLVDQVIVALDEADAAVAELDAPLDTVDAEKLTSAHAAVKTVTDLMKSDIATVLTLQVPLEAAGDND